MALPRVVTITRRRYLTDAVPDQFTFVDVADADLSSNYESAPVTISGMNPTDTAVITVTGGTYSINGGVFVSTPGLVMNGDEIVAAGTAPATNSAQTDVVVTIGGVSDTFSISTEVLDTMPDAFAFTDLSTAAISTTYESNTITVSGLNSSAAVTIDTTGLSGLVGYSKNGGAYTVSAGSAVNGDTFKVRLTTSGLPEITRSTTLTIGGVSDTYSVTTAEYTPSLDFSDPRNSQYIAAIAA